MAPEKRKVSFSPTEEHVDSPPLTKKPRPYIKRVAAETAATSRPKRARREPEQVTTSQTPAKRPYRKTGKVSHSKSKTTTSVSRQPSASSSSKNTTSQAAVKKGRGRPKGTVNGQKPTPEVEVSEGPQEKKGRGRPKKTAVESKPAVKPKVSTKSQNEADDYAIADYDEEDLQDSRSYWLMKAEPETRIEKGVDVRFSIDDLRNCPEPEPWDGKPLVQHISFKGVLFSNAIVQVFGTQLVSRSFMPNYKIYSSYRSSTEQHASYEKRRLCLLLPFQL
jgi:hypothetical protein